MAEPLADGGWPSAVSVFCTFDWFAAGPEAVARRTPWVLFQVYLHSQSPYDVGSPPEDPRWMLGTPRHVINLTLSLG